MRYALSQLGNHLPNLYCHHKRGLPVIVCVCETGGISTQGRVGEECGKERGVGERESVEEKDEEGEGEGELIRGRAR